MWQGKALFLRVWGISFAAVLIVAWVMFHPERSLPTLWHLRAIQSADDLSNRALSQGVDLRAVEAEDAPAFDEDAYHYAQRLRQLQGELAQRRAAARRDAVAFLGLVLLLPLLVAAFALGARNYRIIM